MLSTTKEEWLEVYNSFKRPIKPDNLTGEEKKRWWKTEEEKWISGVGHLTGAHYHYLTQQYIKGRVQGEIFLPDLRFADWIIFNKIQECIDKKRPLGIIKGRGMGLSCIGGGALPNYFIRVHKGTTVLMTSEEQSKISSLFNDKLLLTFDNYDKDIVAVKPKVKEEDADEFDLRPTIENKNASKHSVYLKIDVSAKEDDKIHLSEIYCQETSERPSSVTAFSGKGAIFGFYDEFPLHGRKKELLSSSIECFKDTNGNIDGFLLWGGTCESRLNAEQLNEFRVLIKDSELWDTEILFVPFWLTKYLDRGYPDKERALKEREEKLAKLEKGEDKSLVIAHKKQHPVSLDEIFDLAEGSRFEEDVREKIQIQAKNVRNANIPLMKCRLVSMSEGVQTVESKKPNVIILEHPKQGVQYIQGIDGVATGTETGEEEGSDVASVIVKLFDPSGDSFAPVCIYTERPVSVESSYIHILSQARYYNKHGGLTWIDAEGSVGTTDHFSNFLQKEGMIKYAMHRKDLSGKGNINEKKFFQPRDKHMMDWQFKQANIFLRKYIDRVKMLPLLEDMLKVGNADILDAWLMTLIILGVDFDKPIKPKVTMKQRQILRKYRDAQGKVLQKWVTV